MNYLTIYLFIGFIISLITVRNEKGSWVEPLLIIFYPFTEAVRLCFLLLDKIGWNLEVEGSDYKEQVGIPIKSFDFRKPTYPGKRGFAITIFYIEFQFWKYKK